MISKAALNILIPSLTLPAGDWYHKHWNMSKAKYGYTKLKTV